MSEQEIIVEQNFIGQLVEEKPKDDPMVVRWGYNPGQRNIPNNPLRTGLNSTFIPWGKFFAHSKFKTPFENCTIDEYKPKEFIGVVSAAESEFEVRNALESWGYQSFFYGETDYATVTAINAVILPPLTYIRELFDENSPIPKNCLAEDEYDLGEPREHCATCHLLWVKSDALTAYIQEVAKSGLTVTMMKDGVPSPRIVTPTLEQLEKAREVVLRGLQIYIRKASEDWATITSELDNKLRVKLNEPEHYLRKDLHQPKPQNKEAELANRQIQANQETNSDILTAMSEESRANREFMMQLAEQNAQTQQQMAQFMGMFAGLLNPQAVPPPTQQPAPEAKVSTPKGKDKTAPDGK